MTKSHYIDTSSNPESDNTCKHNFVKQKTIQWVSKNMTNNKLYY